MGSTSGSGSVSADNGTIWQPSSGVSLADATLWHLVKSPALYTLHTELSIGGTCSASASVMVLSAAAVTSKEPRSFDCVLGDCALLCTMLKWGVLWQLA